ncbi:cyclin-like protein, partial [Nannochloropsis oceanica]
YPLCALPPTTGGGGREGVGRVFVAATATTDGCKFSCPETAGT